MSSERLTVSRVGMSPARRGESESRLVFVSVMNVCCLSLVPWKQTLNWRFVCLRFSGDWSWELHMQGSKRSRIEHRAKQHRPQIDPLGVLGWRFLQSCPSLRQGEQSCIFPLWSALEAGFPWGGDITLNQVMTFGQGWFSHKDSAMKC